MNLIIIYLISINLIAFLSMGIDKYKAIHHKWRISERALFLSAFLFGSIGSMLGMYLFHHKTKHPKFVYGIPAIFILQAVSVLTFFHLYQPSPH